MHFDLLAEALRECEAALVVCDGDVLDSADTATLKKAIHALGAGKKTMAVAPDVARALSHDLRTPLSAMAGWLHLMESGKLDAEGTKRAIGKLRGQRHTYADVPVVVTYHPAYLLRTLHDKGKAWADLCLARDTFQRAQGGGANGPAGS